MRFVFLGSPGVGKGTYATKVIKKYNIPTISTGDMLRKAVKHETELGLKAKEYMNRGDLVPDNIVISLIKERIAQEDCSKGFILDGFPRTIAQAENLNNEIKLDAVISFTAPKEIIIQRLSNRRVCKDCGSTFNIANIPPKIEGKCDNCNGDLYQRDDDKPESISERLDVYLNKTAPLIEYYKEKGILFEVDASLGSVDNDVNPKIMEDTYAIIDKFVQ